MSLGHPAPSVDPSGATEPASSLSVVRTSGGQSIEERTPHGHDTAFFKVVTLEGGIKEFRDERQRRRCTQSYHTNRGIKVQTWYNAHEQRSGNETEYDEDGDIVRITPFSRDKKHGKETLYNQDGSKRLKYYLLDKEVEGDDWFQWKISRYATRARPRPRKNLVHIPADAKNRRPPEDKAKLEEPAIHSPYGSLLAFTRRTLPNGDHIFVDGSGNIWCRQSYTGPAHDPNSVIKHQMWHDPADEVKAVGIGFNPQGQRTSVTPFVRKKRHGIETILHEDGSQASIAYEHDKPIDMEEWRLHNGLGPDKSFIVDENGYTILSIGQGETHDEIRFRYEDNPEGATPDEIIRYELLSHGPEGASFPLMIANVADATILAEDEGATPHVPAIAPEGPPPPAPT